MSWRVIAEKDVRDAVRDGTLQWNTLFLTLLGAAIAYNHAQLGSGNELPTDLSALFTLVVPLAAVLVAHESIAYERGTGRIHTTLSLPHTRRSVVVGTAVGRGVVVATAVWVALAVAGFIAIVSAAPISPRVYLGYSVATIFLGVAVAAMTVGISALYRSTTLALVTGVCFVLVSLGWPTILGFAWMIGANDPMPGWLTTVGGFDPIRGYAKTAVLLAGTDIGALGSDGSIIGPPLLAGWAVGVLELGYRRFEHVDL